MRKLNKIQLKQREAIANSLRETYSELQKNSEAFNKLLANISELKDISNKTINLENQNSLITQDNIQLQQKYYDERSSELLENISALQDTFNDAIYSSNYFTQEISELQQDYYDERSEQWQESEAAENYQEWIDEWSSIELEEIGLDLSGTEIELTEGEDYADQLNELPINP